MAVYIIRGLFRAYLNRPRELQSFPMHRYFSRYIKWQDSDKELDVAQVGDENFIRLIADYIAGMTDHFSMKEYERLVGA